MNKKILLFYIAVVILNLAANFAHPVTPTFFAELNVGSYMFGLALASMLTLNFIFSPFWGVINTYIGSKTGMLISCVGYAVGQYFFMSATSEAGIAIARGLTGIFTSGCFVSVLTYIVNITEDEEAKGRYLAVSATIQMVASAFGYFIGGLLGEISVQAAFYAQIAVLCFCGVYTFVVCENDAVVSFKDINWSEVFKKSNPFSAFMESRKLVSLYLGFILLLCVLQSMGNICFDQSFNYYLRDIFKLTSGYNGMIKGATGILSLVLNSTFTMWLIRKTKLQKSIGFLFITTSLFMGIAIFTSSSAIFIVSNIFMYAFSAACLPVLQTILARYPAGKDGNLLMGLFNSMKSLGNVAGALCAGLYAISSKLPFVLGLLAYIAAAGLSFIVYSKYSKA